MLHSLLRRAVLHSMLRRAVLHSHTNMLNFTSLRESSGAAPPALFGGAAQLAHDDDAMLNFNSLREIGAWLETLPHVGGEAELRMIRKMCRPCRSQHSKQWSTSAHNGSRPRNTRNEGGHRRVPLFLFDSHYVLAQQYVQELDVQGQCKVVVLEALKCRSPDFNNGEDNSAF